MEFPDLGNHCSNPACKQLDFLPIRCASCHQLFCKDHYTYDQHSCNQAYSKNNQVPECPLCGVPIPVRPGEMPDQRVSQHIDANCNSQPGLELKGKIFTNRCTVPRCKKKELVPFNCPKCRSNFCISHRLELDHSCSGRPSTTPSFLSRTGAAAVWRAARSISREYAQKGDRPPVTQLRQAQSDLTDDQALALALQASQAASSAPTPIAAASCSAQETRRLQEEQDAALAAALDAQEREERAARLRRGVTARAGGQSSQEQGSSGKGCTAS